jgi:hypothetical protein
MSNFCLIKYNYGRYSVTNVKVMTNEKRGGLNFVSFNWSRFKLFTLKFSKNLYVQTQSCERPKTAQRTLFLLFENNNCFQITETYEKNLIYFV